MSQRAEQSVSPKITLERVLTVRSTIETAKLLGVSKAAVRRWVKSGKLPALRIGADYYLTEEPSLTEQACQQCREKITNRPPNAIFYLQCYQLRRKASHSNPY